MEKKNINKNQLSKVIGVGSSVIGKWVSGSVTDLRLPSLISLSNFFEVTIDNLALNNIEHQNYLTLFYKEYVYIPEFNWEDELGSSVTNKKIPKSLIHDELHNLFVVNHSSEYYGLYPKKSILIFSNKFELANNDVLLVRNKILKDILLIKYSNSIFLSVLTNELVDIEQYNIKGCLMSIIFDQVFLDLS